MYVHVERYTGMWNELTCRIVRAKFSNNYDVTLRSCVQGFPFIATATKNNRFSCAWSAFRLWTLASRLCSTSSTPLLNSVRPKLLWSSHAVLLYNWSISTDKISFWYFSYIFDYIELFRLYFHLFSHDDAQIKSKYNWRSNRYRSKFSQIGL